MFAMAVTSTVVWYKLNVSPSEFRIRGRLAGLQGDEQLRTHFRLLYLRREYENPSSFDFDWIVLGARRLPAGSSVTLVVDRSTTGHEDVDTYRLPILESFYDSGNVVELTYDRAKRTISFDTDQGNKVLEPVQYEPETHHSKLGEWLPELFGVAQAQSRENLKDMSKRLESTDPIVRLDARADLAQTGTVALPFIQEVLKDSHSSYFLRLGAISALKMMKGVSLKMIDQPSRCAIVLSSYADDKALQYEAQQLLQNNADIESPRQCGINATIPLNCAEPDLRLDVRRPISVPNKNVLLYLFGVSTSDSIDLYILRTIDMPAIRGDKLSHDRFRQFLTSLKSAQGDTLPEGSYLRVKLKRHESVTFNTPPGQVRLTVTETHYMSDYADVQICP
jgi:hypothetical protein